jgi:hypothetical protein
MPTAAGPQPFTRFLVIEARAEPEKGENPDSALPAGYHPASRMHGATCAHAVIVASI